MDVTESLEQMLLPLRGKSYDGGDFQVQLFLPLAIRYSEEDQTITILADMYPIEKPWVRHVPDFFRPLFGTNHFDFWLEEPMVLDNTDVLLGTPSKIIELRIEQALRHFKLDYKICRK